MSRRIGILGYGRFGRALAEVAEGRGLSLSAFDPQAEVPSGRAASSVEALVSSSEVVVVAVPVARTRAVLESIAPHLRAEQLVLDVGSVKHGPVASMRAVLGERVPWIGTHPLFGPTSLALGERPLRVVICPTPEHPAAAIRARALYAELGCEVIEQDPEAHDRAMADTHALAFFVAKGLIDARAGEGVVFTPPSFQAIARTIESVRSDAGHLFYTIQRENPFAAEARRRLIDALVNVDEQLENDLAPTISGSAMSIPDLGAGAPELKQTRELIDALDRELVSLLVRRAELAKRAQRAKEERGQGVFDAERERTMLETRAEWAEAEALPSEAVRDVFESILRFSRTVQRTRGEKK